MNEEGLSIQEIAKHSIAIADEAVTALDLERQKRIALQSILGYVAHYLDNQSAYGNDYRYRLIEAIRSIVAESNAPAITRPGE